MRPRSIGTNPSSKQKIKVTFSSSTLIKQLLHTLIRIDMLFYYHLRNFWVFSTTKKERHEQLIKLQNIVKHVLQNTVRSEYDKVSGS